MKNYKINVVLVRTIYERNVGSVSRAMSNMGAHRLILIDPKCEFTIEAHQAAANGQDGLTHRTTYKNWEEFYEKESVGIRIAFTARDGKGRLVNDFKSELLRFEKNNSEIFTSEDPLEIYLFFGPEDWGLSAEDLSLMNMCCSIPIYGPNRSLNLSQAVLLSLFILRQEWGGQLTEFEGAQNLRKPLVDQARFPEEALKSWLSEMGFDVSNRKISAFSVMRRMLLQNAPTKKELNILEIVLQQSIRKLKEYNELRKKNSN